MNISDIQNNCLNNIEKHHYQSFDVFDALTNPFLNKVSQGNPLLRRIFIQLNAKSPIDLHFLGMKKMIHTKTVSDLLWFYSISSLNNKQEKIDYFFDLLLKLKNEAGDGWGLNFPYTTRFIDADTHMPNLYNTMNSAIAICYAYNHLNEKKKKIAHDSLTGTFDFIETKLGFVDEGSKGWYLYYPGQKYPTYNVNAFVIYFLCFLKKLGFGNLDLIDKRINCILELIIIEQENNGSWFYSRSNKGKWVDGFHSAFIIESLSFAFKNGFNNIHIEQALAKGIMFYTREMFTKEGYPKFYYDSGKFPIESQNIAQAIQTLSLLMLWVNYDFKFLLSACINVAISNLYNPKGYFFYKKEKLLTYKQRYIRWTTSPMILALEYSKHCVV